RSGDAADRREGVEQALHEKGVAPHFFESIEITYAGAGYSAVKAALCAPHRPTAVFAWSDEVAAGLMTLARGMGLRVPKDLSVVGFASPGFCNHPHPPLTSVRQPIYEMASHAFTLLTRRIKGEPVEEAQALFPPSLDIRGSCAARS